MPVARDHLGRDWVRLQAEAFASDALHLGFDLRIGPDGPRQLTHSSRLQRAGDSTTRPVELESPAGELPAEGDRLCVDTVRASDADGVPVLIGPSDHSRERAVDALADEAARVLNLEGKGGVDDVGRRESVVEPASLRPKLLGHGINEGRRIVVCDPLDLRDTPGRRWNGLRTAPS